MVAATSCAVPQDRAEADYLRAKREAVLAVARDSFPQLAPAYDSIKKDLDRRLRSIIGPPPLSGFLANGDLNLEGHYDGDPAFGMLDGIRFRSGDYSRRLFVTTPAIISAWLAANYKGVGIDSALNSPSVLTAAIVGEAVITRYADLPLVDAKRRGIVSATLTLTAQDIGPWPPTELLVSVVRRDRIFIVQATYVACYGEHVLSIPGMNRIVAQVDSLARLLRPQ